MSVMDAAFNVAEDFPGGGSALARAIDKNHFSFLHELNGTGSAKLGLLTAVKMTKRTGDLRILLAFALECGQMCIPLPEALTTSADDCMRAMGGTTREFGELCQEVCLSLGDDGDVSDTELGRVEREAGQLMAQLQHLLATLRVRNQMGKRTVVQS